MNEIDELKAARKEIKELKAALADAHLDWCLERAFLDIACEHMGTQAKALKKHSVDACGRTKEKGLR